MAGALQRLCIFRTEVRLRSNFSHGQTYTHLHMHVLVVLLLFVSLALLLALLYPMHRTSTLSFFNAITLQLFDAIFKDFFGLCEGSTEVPLKCWSIFCHGGMYNSHLCTHLCTCRLSALVSLALLFARLYPMHRISTLPITLQFVQYSFRRHFRTA